MVVTDSYQSNRNVQVQNDKDKHMHWIPTIYMKFKLMESKNLGVDATSVTSGVGLPGFK